MSPARIGTATARGPQTQDQSHLRVLGRAKFSTLRRLEDSVDVRLEQLPSTGLLLAPTTAPGSSDLREARFHSHSIIIGGIGESCGNAEPFKPP